MRRAIEQPRPYKTRSHDRTRLGRIPRRRGACPWLRRQTAHAEGRAEDPTDRPLHRLGPANQEPRAVSGGGGGGGRGRHRVRAQPIRAVRTDRRVGGRRGRRRRDGRWRGRWRGGRRGPQPCSRLSVRNAIVLSSVGCEYGALALGRGRFRPAALDHRAPAQAFGTHAELAPPRRTLRFDREQGEGGRRAGLGR